MSVLKLTSEEARDIVYEDSEDFKVIEDDIYETDRWTESHEVVVKQVSTSKFFSSTYRQGATEYQDEQPYEYDDEVTFYEVYARDVIAVEYVRVK